MTGSFINRMMEGSTPPVPVVGMGVTRTMYSDRQAWTVVQVINDRKIVVQEDNAKRIDKNGMSELQEYEYTPNPNGRRETLTFRKNGRWISKGQSLKGGDGWALGFRRAYHDYSF